MAELSITPGPWVADSEDTPFQLAYGEVIGGDPTGNYHVADESGHLLCCVYARDDFDAKLHAYTFSLVPLYEDLRKATNNLRAAVKAMMANPLDYNLRKAAESAGYEVDAAIESLNAALEVNGG